MIVFDPAREPGRMLTEGEGAPRATGHERWFWPVVAVIGAVAVGLRVLIVIGYAPANLSDGDTART